MRTAGGEAAHGARSCQRAGELGLLGQPGGSRSRPEAAQPGVGIPALPLSGRGTEDTFTLSEPQFSHRQNGDSKRARLHGEGSGAWRGLALSLAPSLGFLERL